MGGFVRQDDFTCKVKRKSKFPPLFYPYAPSAVRTCFVRGSATRSLEKSMFHQVAQFTARGHRCIYDIYTSYEKRLPASPGLISVGSCPSYRWRTHNLSSYIGISTRKREVTAADGKSAGVWRRNCTRLMVTVEMEPSRRFGTIDVCHQDVVALAVFAAVGTVVPQRSSVCLFPLFSCHK